MRVLWYFFVYSVLGWMAETVWAAFWERDFKNRRTMTVLPMCPVYGIGAVLLTVLVPVGTSPIMIFVYGFFLLSAVEYAYSIFWQHFFGIVWWDYSAMRSHIGGRVSGMYSIMWGIMAIGVVKILHPAVEAVFSDSVWIPAAAVMTVIFAADTVRTCQYIQKKSENECRNFICFERIEK